MNLGSRIKVPIIQSWNPNIDMVFLLIFNPCWLKSWTRKTSCSGYTWFCRRLLGLVQGCTHLTLPTVCNIAMPHARLSQFLHLFHTCLTSVNFSLHVPLGIPPSTCKKDLAPSHGRNIPHLWKTNRYGNIENRDTVCDCAMEPVGKTIFNLIFLTSPVPPSWWMTWKLPGGLQRQVIKHWNHSKSIDVFPTEESWPQNSKTPWKQRYKLKDPSEFELVLRYPWYLGLLRTPMKIMDDFPVQAAFSFKGFLGWRLVHLQSLRHSELSECDTSGVFWDRLGESGMSGFHI